MLFNRLKRRDFMTKWDDYVEKPDRHDLALFAPDDPKKCLAVFEMKKWMSSCGEQEIPGIKTDVQSCNS